PGSVTAAPGVDRAPGGPARAVPGVPDFRSARGITLYRGAGVFPPTAYMCGALLPTVSGGTASLPGSATGAPGVDRAPGGPARAVPGVPDFRSARGITLQRGAGVFPPTAYMCGALLPTVSGGTASLPGSATAAPGVDRVPGGPARAVPGMPDFRSARGITLQRGAGVFPPTAYMCDALLPTVSGGTASLRGSATAALGVADVRGVGDRAVPGVPGFRSARGITLQRGAGVFLPTVSGGTASLPESATAAPGVDRVPGGPARAVPGVPGFRSARGITPHRGAGVLPPTAYTYDAFVPTVSGGTASPRRSGTVVLGTGRALAAASRAALGKPGFLRAPETIALSPAGVRPPASCALGGSSPIGPEATASSPWS